MADPAALFPLLPSVEKVLASPAGRALAADYARDAVAASVRDTLDELRAAIRAGTQPPPADFTLETVAARATERLRRDSRIRARPVVNATGVVLHTNLGRAPLAESAVEAAARAARGSLALEYDVESGGRGDRDSLVEEHLVALTGAAAATVVNNNAAAVLLALNTLADGREVIVSRGELVEIGGSFRIPEVLAKSGAVMREVGTTNRTHRSDVEAALGPRTAVLLKVHTSNYRIVGFTAAVELADLRAIVAGRDDVAVVEDLGAGALVDLERWGLPHEPVVRERLAAGADIVTFSGDKLLGGPQCGLIVGRSDLVERMRRNPLKRALRCDKSTLAALEETLRIYRFDPAPERALPALWALARPLADVERVGREAAARLAAALGPAFRVTVEASSACVGSGSQPQIEIPSHAVAIVSDELCADAVAARFRAADPPILGRIERDRFLLDVRAVADPQSLVPSWAAAGA